MIQIQTSSRRNLHDKNTQIYVKLQSNISTKPNYGKLKIINEYTDSLYGALCAISYAHKGVYLSGTN